MLIGLIPEILNDAVNIENRKHCIVNVKYQRNHNEKISTFAKSCAKNVYIFTHAEMNITLTKQQIRTEEK